MRPGPRPDFRPRARWARSRLLSNKDGQADGLGFRSWPQGFLKTPPGPRMDTPPSNVHPLLYQVSRVTAHSFRTEGKGVVVREGAPEAPL